MSDYVLNYVGYDKPIEDLQLGECTIRPTGNASGARWWMLWFYVPRDNDGVAENFAVPIIPNGSYTESGPGGRSWGFTRVAARVGASWNVSPSINVLQTRECHPGEHQTIGSLWHHTPEVLGVPDGEVWQS